jgi:hypothetical protein
LGKSNEFKEHDFKNHDFKSEISTFSELEVEFQRYFLALVMIIHKELLKEDRPISRDHFHYIDDNMNKIIKILIDMLRAKKD